VNRRQVTYPDRDGTITVRVIAWTMTAVVALAICYGVTRIPVQATDSLVPILQAQQTASVAAAFFGSLGAAYLRPMRIAQIQALFEVSNGHYFLAYKTFHVALIVACFVLFVLAAGVQTTTDLVVLPFALTVLIGLHTFRGLVWEAYPINHFLEVAVFCLLALVLTKSRGGWWADWGAALAFVTAALTLESGLLVWVVVVAARSVGFHGVSRRGVLIVTMLLVAYFVVRFPFLGVGAPTLAERSSGFGFGRLEPDELVRRFGAWPYGFYAYNVLSSFVSVLASEPRGGTWTALGDLRAARLVPGTIINVVSSVMTTAALGWFFYRRFPTWRTAGLDDRDRICVVCVVVLAANAAMSYGYTKDEIMSPAGVFYALAAFVAIRELGSWIAERPRSRWKNTAYAVALATAASGWAIRAAGLPYQMQIMAFNVRNEWVYIDDWLARQRASPTTAEGKRIVTTLRDEALARTVVNPYVQSQAARASRLFP
jgi:hypothetical protein